MAQKGRCQEPAASQLPSGIPANWAMDSPAVANPMVRTISWGLTSTGMEAQICGETKAALTPARNRKRIIVQNPCANPHSAVMTMNPVSPASSTRRRSRPSDIGPAIRAKTA